MIYTYTRIIFALLILTVAIILILKSAAKSKFKSIILSAIAAAIISTGLYFVPIENLFLTFSTPEEAFGYVCGGEVLLKVEGTTTDFVVSFDNGIYKNLIVPGSDGKWKLGFGIDMKKQVIIFCNKAAIVVYKYKNTNEYYIVISGTSDKQFVLNDNLDSDFYYYGQALDIENSDTKWQICAAYIPGYNNQYVLNINDKTITFAGNNS